MSVTLIFPYATYAAGSTVTLDRATEAALVQQGRATYTSNPGPVFSPLTAVEQQSLRDFLPSGQALVSRAGITADDTGTAWLGAPSLLSFSAVLASGSSTTVLLEVRDAAGTVATAATIVADTLSQTLRNALLMRQQSEYRFRRSSGTGSVTITV